MLTLLDFKRLSYVEQDEIITEEGIYLLNYVQGEIMSDLYKLSNFFVKISYSLENDNEPVIIAFRDLESFKLFNNFKELN